MAFEFIDSEWVTISIKGQSAKLRVREANALEGARYVSALQRNRPGLDDNAEGALENIISLHLAMITACTLESADITPAFPADAPEAEKRAWVNRLPWADITGIANEIMAVGYPKNSAV